MQTLYIDLSNKTPIPTINAKQGDVGRKFRVVVSDAGVPFVFGNHHQLSVWYEGASGSGNYSSIGEAPAIVFDGNTAEIELIVQMLKAEGDGEITLVLNESSGNQIGMWNIRYVVEGVVGVGSEAAQEYYTALSELAGITAENAMKAEEAANKIKVESFNGRSGNVIPESGDYTAEMVGAKPSDWMPTPEEIGAHPDTWMPTAEDVGARPNTWTPTPAEVGSAPAVESEEHPGCYYRIVDGEIEWINPPMTDSVEYKTAEQYGNKAIYTKRITFTNTTNITSSTTAINVPHGISNLNFMLTADVTTSGYVLPYVTEATSIAITAWNSTNLVLYNGKSTWDSGRKWYIWMKYLKNE